MSGHVFLGQESGDSTGEFTISLEFIHSPFFPLWSFTHMFNIFLFYNWTDLSCGFGKGILKYFAL